MSTAKLVDAARQAWPDKSAKFDCGPGTVRLQAVGSPMECSGIIVFTRSARNIVENNRSTESGIDIRPPILGFPGALNNTIQNNLAVRNSALPFIPNANFGQSFDLKDGNVNCDNNLWFGNRYRTINQPCVPTGGQQI